MVKRSARGKIPVAAGFGIARPEHISSLLRAGADGAIVGSALVGIVAQHSKEPWLAADALKDAVVAFKHATVQQ